MAHTHDFPLGAGVATLFFAILLGLMFFIQIGLLGHAYSALGLDPRVATLVLFGSLLGSYINLPLVRLPEQHVVSREVVELFGVPFLAPVGSIGLALFWRSMSEARSFRSCCRSTS